MRSNCIFFAWNRAIPGRERPSAEHYQEFVTYLDGLQKQGTIRSFDVVFLEAHGGDMNGFFLIKGDRAKLVELVATEDWTRHQVRALLHLQGTGVVMGVTGDAIPELMRLYTSALPS